MPGISIYSIYLIMKKIFFLFILFVAVYNGRGLAQDSARQAAPVLSSYYTIQAALVNGDAHTAALGAGNLTKALQGASGQGLPAASREAILKEAKPIAAREDLDVQRAHFAGLSTAMAALAKSVRLSADPVYEQYCPMKKAYWLSADKDIKNPYFGNAMLTCGKVVETF
jgi:hypothetical protein